MLEDGTLSTGWTPENGLLWGWRGYDEYVLPYLLALGSPTHPVPESSWDALTSEYAWTQYGNGDKFLTPGGSFQPLAYIYHYPACWIDFREKHDNYANYWQNAICAMKANRQYCIDWAENEENYDNNLWGWTAAYGPDGYQVFGDPFNGTVAPSAVGASIPLIPEYAIQTLRYMYETYRDRIYGEYGFVDGFNVVVDWHDQDYLGINHGSLSLMIEDFRSGLVWSEFMQNEYIIEGMAKAGFVDGFHPDKQGFIRDWLVIGPFGTSADEAFQTDYLGENSMSESPKAGDKCCGKMWIEYHSPIGPEECNYIDFNRLFLSNDNVCAYAFVTVVSNRDQNVYPRVGSDDFIKVWINNELVHSNQTVRTAAEDQDIISGVLFREGSNKVLVKVCDVGQEWGFYLRFTDNAGTPIHTKLW